MENIISEFVGETCAFRSRPNYLTFRAVVLKYRFGSDDYDDDYIQTNITRTLTGSVSEFYIEPMLPFVGDIDIMWHDNDKIIVSSTDRTRRYAQLPYEFHTRDEIKVYETVDSQFPGFVFIRRIGDFVESVPGNLYEFKPAGVRYNFVIWSVDNPADPHGPSQRFSDVFYDNDDRGLSIDAISLDSVPCFRCLEWPAQAQKWEKRSRPQNWPDSETIQRIVSNGCDLVCVPHRLSKDDERRRLCRLSFSRAETVLLNTWTATQQIIYHLLRYYVKKAGFAEHTDESGLSTTGVFCNYHLKTLVLWAYEEQSEQWWRTSLVRLAVRLLQMLGEWLDSGVCRQYFITECNLFDYLAKENSLSLADIISPLKSISVDRLSIWFQDTYIKECIHQFPDDISLQQMDICSVTELPLVLRSLAHHRELAAKAKSFEYIIAILDHCDQLVCEEALNFRTYYRFLVDLQRVDSRVTPFFIAVVLLHASKHDCEVEDLLAIDMLLKCSQSNDGVPQCCNQLIDERNLIDKATSIMMELRSEMKIHALQVELVKAILHASLELGAGCSVDEHELFHLSHFYLGYLYYVTKHYREAIDHLLPAIRSRYQLSLVIETTLLSQCDTVSTVSGLIALYNFIKLSSMSQRQQNQRVNVLSAELCTFFLTIDCWWKEQSLLKLSSLMSVARSYRCRLKKKQTLFVGDVISYYFVEMCMKSAADVRRKLLNEESSATQCSGLHLQTFNEATLRFVLMQLSVEYLTEVRETMLSEYGDSFALVTTDYEAMYAYKCGRFEYCLRLCQENVDMLLDKMHTATCAVFKVYWSELLRLMDDVCTLFIAHVYLADRDPDSSLLVDQLALSLYLIIQCQLKLKLAPTLVVDSLRRVLTVIRLKKQLTLASRLILTTAYRKAMSWLRNASRKLK